MIAMTLTEIARVVGGQLADPATADVQVSGEASIDSRRVAADGLFVAIDGERVDGHDFAPAAVAAGAAAVLGSRELSDPTIPAVIVEDPNHALGLLARHVVDTLAPRVIALTGSQGKTGVKDMLAQVLGAALGADAVVATAANHNNELGVPITVLGCTEATRYLIVEMGARGIGHIAYLCGIAPPDIAGVLNVGSAHVGEFGSVENIAVAKGEIVEALGDSGTAVLNADDERVAAMTGRTAASVLSFGLAGDVRWRSVELDGLGRARCELGYQGRWLPLHLATSGLHQVPNAAAAAAFALAAGLDFSEIVAGLAAARPLSAMRMEVVERGDGLVVVNDAYNANPASMLAALQALGAMRTRRGGRAIAVLGEMRELGQDAEREHRSLGAAAVREGVDVLIAVGDVGDQIAGGARDGGLTPGTEVIVTPTREDALQWLGENVSAPDVVLVKASRGAALEAIAAGLLAMTVWNDREDPRRESDPAGRRTGARVLPSGHPGGHQRPVGQGLRPRDPR